MTQPTSEALSDEQLKMLRRNAVFALPFRHDNPPLATDRDITDDGRSAEFWHVIPLLDALDQALARCEELEDDLLFMLQTRKVLYEGNRLILLACGTYTDCQERGGDYPLHKAMEDVMTASRDARVQFDRLMNERVATEEAQ